MTFTELGISEKLTQKLAEAGITEPSSVQKKVIPLVREGKNVMFQSETGTGKTFAYLLPLAERLESSQSKDVRLLIVSPTYELAGQIKTEFKKVSDLGCALCIGGSPISRQTELLKEKPAAVIGGSERLLELIHLKKLKADKTEVLVLDEADRLLSPELRESTVALMERLPKKVQIIANSATVSAFTKKTLEKIRQALPGETDISPVEFITLPPEDVLKKRIEHWALFAERRDKIDTLRSFINAADFTKMIVFTSRGDQIENITSKLKYKKIECEGLSRKTDKKIRKTIIDRFRSGKLKVLITTDLTSRGLDINGI
ncbi:MAG: DEAD/DEAH box helicase, partial [Treponema sp.]|nr:DEAD/DEAH box helicase [Treponema sp.]